MWIRDRTLIIYGWSCFIHPVFAALTGLNNCQDWKGDWIKEGEYYIPKKNDLCMSCLCNQGHPTMCKSVSCSPPDCATMLQPVEGECCKFICIAPPRHPNDVKENGTGYGGDVHPETNVDAVNTTDLGLRLVASTVTSFLVLALLLFMVHRLRQRRMLVMMRRLNAETRSEDDAVAYVSGYDDVQIGIEFPPYEEPPPPYSPPKPPDDTHGEAPPPYSEENPGTENGGNSGNNNRNTLNRNHGNVASLTQNASAETSTPVNDGLSNGPITEIIEGQRSVNENEATCRLAPEEENHDATMISDTLQGDSVGSNAQSQGVNSTQLPQVPGAPITGSQQLPEPSQILVSMRNNSPQSTIIRDHSKHRHIKTNIPSEGMDTHERLSGSPRAVVIKRSDSIEIKRSSHSPRNSFYLDDDTDFQLGEQVSIHDLTPQSQTLPKSHSNAVHHPRNKNLKESDSKNAKHKNRSPKSKRNSTCLTGLGSSPRNNRDKTSVLENSRNSRLVHDHDNNGALVLCESPLLEKKQNSCSGFRISKALDSVPVGPLDYSIDLGPHTNTITQQAIGYQNNDIAPKFEQNEIEDDDNIKVPPPIVRKQTPELQENTSKPNKSSIQSDANNVPGDKAEISNNNDTFPEFSDQGPDTDEEFHSASGTPATPSLPGIPPVLASVSETPPIASISSVPLTEPQITSPDMQSNMHTISNPDTASTENYNQDPKTKSDDQVKEHDVIVDDDLQGACGDIVNDNSVCDSASTNSNQPVRKFKPLTIWKDGPGVDVDKAMSPGECSLARTPISPEMRPLHARSNSLISQASLFSVCSETGERKKPKNRQNGQTRNSTNQGQDVVGNVKNTDDDIENHASDSCNGAINVADGNVNDRGVNQSCVGSDNVNDERGAIQACSSPEHSNMQTSDETLSNDSLYPETHKYMQNNENNTTNKIDGRVSKEPLIMIPASVKRWNLELDGKSRPVSYPSSLEGDNNTLSPSINRNSSYHDNVNNSNSAKQNDFAHHGARPKQSNKIKTKRKDITRNNYKDGDNNVIQNNLSKVKNMDKTTSPKWAHSKNINHKNDTKANPKLQSKFKQYGFIDKVCNNETIEQEHATTIATREQMNLTRERESESTKVKKSKNKLESVNGHKKKKSRNSFFSQDHESTK
ncbi:unnamed protein product [Owenia fusiformis]|uniref:Uncharacterized protein n=1 Tax=Owenia fusiformis TaxID=6347 RepID=A0A8J1XNF0_OWEFU|nr:unnamed protein product [Owenia fusiformis]